MTKSSSRRGKDRLTAADLREEPPGPKAVAAGRKFAAPNRPSCPRQPVKIGTLAACASVQMQAEVELIAARFEGDRLRYHVGRQPCATGIDPDDTARAATAWRFPDLPLRRVVVHSTSWRYEQGTLLLTYLAYSDDLPFDDLPHVLPRDAKAVGTGVAAVVAHAIGHLAFLVRQEPDKYSHALSRETLAHLAQVEPDVAGRINGERAA